ncbi:MAG: hypothetical protein ACE5R6_01365 [Candidatus Heimdallarchaeota archaeon]
MEQEENNIWLKDLMRGIQDPIYKTITYNKASIRKRPRSLSKSKFGEISNVSILYGLEIAIVIEMSDERELYKNELLEQIYQLRFKNEKPYRGCR